MKIVPNALLERVARQFAFGNLFFRASEPRNGFFGDSQATLGALLGALGALLAALGALLAALGALLGRSCDALGRFFWRSWALLGRSWLVLSAFCDFPVRFRSIFERF